MGLFDKIKEPVFLKDDSDAERQLSELEKLYACAEGDLAARLEEEIKRVKQGIAGEQNVRYELANSHIPMFVLHDLNLEQDGLTAQIDYLIITRKNVFVVECKNLYGDIEINNAGDFSRICNYGNRKVKEGIYSPITQNRRHLELLKQVRSAAISNRIAKLAFEKYFYDWNIPIVVLANPKTVLYDRYAKREIRAQVIKADQLVDFIRQANQNSKEAEFSEKSMEEMARFYLNLHKEQRVDYTKKIREQMQAQAKPTAQAAKDASAQIQNQILCPRCGAVMVLRRATKGANAGKAFYGCSNYPNCRGIVNIR